MTSRRGLAPLRGALRSTAANLPVAVALAGVLIGALTATAIMVVALGATPASADPAAFTRRFSSQGWADVTQAGAAALACPSDAPSCQDGSDPAVPASWVDVDPDPSTVNSSRAVLTIPPKSSVDWVGLYWSGDRGKREAGTEPRCDAAPEGSSPPTLPPAPDQANQIKLGVGDGAYTVVTAGSFDLVTGPGGGSGFQAYLDITALVRPAAAAGQLALTVAELQAAAGPGCSGGWTAVLAYSYPDGPDKNYAPSYRGITVFDGTLATHAGIAQQVRLAGLPASAPTGPPPRLTTSILASGQSLGPDSLSLGSTPVRRTGSGVTGITGLPGPGYQRATSPLPPAAITSDASLSVTTTRDSFLAAVVTLSTPLPVTVKLSIATAADPATAAVGTEAIISVTVSNDADVTASGVVVAVQLPNGLKLTADVPGYDPGTGTWTAGAVGAHGSSTLSLRVLVQDVGSLAGTAQITATDLPNQNPPGAPVGLAVTAIPSPGQSLPPTVPPTIAAESWTWPQVAPAVFFGVGLFLLGLLLLSVAVIRHRARAH